MVWLNHIHTYVGFLNNNKLFAGLLMIFLNIGTKFITVQFSKSCEEYLKLTIAKQVIIFCIAWLGTRSIYEAIALTAFFTILSEHLFNEESSLCIVPHKYRVLHKLKENNEIGSYSTSNSTSSDNNFNNSTMPTQEEINNALVVLEKAKKEQRKQQQQIMYANFNASKF